MTRRPHGAGSVYLHTTTGKYIAQLDLGRNNTGKRIRITRSASTKKEAQAILRSLQAEFSGSRSATSAATDNETVASFLQRWMAHGAPSWQPRTIELYHHQAEHHIIPAIGHLRLADVKPRDVQAMVDKIVAKGYISTANKCRRLLFSALKRAVRWELIERNPVEAIDPVKEQKELPTLWTPEQVRTFLDSNRSHRFFAAYYTLITAGLRRGELLGLRWEDLETGGLWVRQAVKIVDDRPVIGPTKTRASHRYVPLPPDTLAVLAEHRAKQAIDRAMVGSAWLHPELVFPSEIGSIMDPKNFYRVWKGAVASAGVPAARIHDMRHLHVSLLIMAGEDVKTVSERVGHTSTSFTLDRYGHLFSAQRQRAARSLNDLLTFEKREPT